MRISISIPSIPEVRNDHLLGVLSSLLDSTDQVLGKRKRASFIIHFIEERLNKVERKEFSNFIKKLIVELKRNESISKVESFSQEEVENSKEFFSRINSFGSFSKLATVSHRVSSLADTKPPSEWKGKLIALRRMVDGQ
jgi:histidinol phosphatase-like PHP family hydrolase